MPTVVWMDHTQGKFTPLGRQSWEFDKGIQPRSHKHDQRSKPFCPPEDSSVSLQATLPPHLQLQIYFLSLQFCLSQDVTQVESHVLGLASFTSSS